MINHYEILGLTENATLAEIKTAYKRLAKQFHPDLNPSLQAEERFKMVVLAYTTLSKTASREKFDHLLTQERRSMTHSYKYTTKRQPPAYSYQRNHGAQKRRSLPIDKKTERLGTLYAIGLVGLLALIIYISTTIVNYYQIRQREKFEARISIYFSKAESYYVKGNQQTALMIVDSLKAFVADNAHMERFTYNLIQEQKKLAVSDFKAKSYKKAVWEMLLYMQYTGHQDQQMLFELAVGYRALNEYEKAIYILNKLLNSNFRRLYTLSLMADIYHFDMNNSELAMKYYDLALKDIEADFIGTYGKAYRLFVSEENTPYIYKKIYRHSAIIFYALGQYKKAQKLLEWVLFFEPEKANSYELLVKTYQQLGKKNSACKVIKKAEQHDIDLSHLNMPCNA
ncbi:MAG: curved DNA-binding protein CbpA [Marivirga sp.]